MHPDNTIGRVRGGQFIRTIRHVVTGIPGAIGGFMLGELAIRSPQAMLTISCIAEKAILTVGRVSGAISSLPIAGSCDVNSVMRGIIDVLPYIGALGGELTVIVPRRYCI